MHIKQILILILLVSVLLPVFNFAEAASLQGGTDLAEQGLNTTASQAGFSISDEYGDNSARYSLLTIIGGIINTILGLTGVIFLVLILAAGEMWLTAGGNSDQVEKARGLIFNAVIGILITFSAYIATNFALPTILGYVGL